MFDGRVLILAPHRDDAVLGCGGLIMKLRVESWDLSTPYFTGKEKPSVFSNTFVRYYNTVHPAVDQAVYDTEAADVSNYGAFTPSTSPLTGVNRLDQIPTVDFITDIEKTVNKIKPHVVLIPYPSFNKDHVQIYEAALTAVRVHDTNWFVPHVLVYEQPQVFHTLEKYDGFKPNKFVSIDVSDKIRLYDLYASQQRAYRSVKLLRSLAVIRGSQCLEPFAESFMIMRSV